ncbi:MAG TPA: uroporphyrinogen decarboxylase, partial [Burkholderiales bacterium]|nr:uroporphyrinogen decarboxylase [Burkholderiales bacterium]
MKNDTLLRALRREPTEYTPQWLMRQAGRYLPEYNETRRRAGSFLGLAKSPALATEVTLQPLERFPLDAAILFSDILTIPDAMGLGLYFAEGEGPRFQRPLREERDILALAAPDIAKLRYVMDAVREIRKALDGRVPLIGFSGSPFTLACYMVEGSGSADWRILKALRHARPELLHRVLEVNARAVASYLNAQIEAGAQLVMLFDTWGGILAHDDYAPFSLAYSRKVLEQVKGVPRILFTKGGNPWLDEIMASGADAIGLDWTCDPRAARRLAANRVALQGNLDPAALFAPEQAVREAARKVLDSFGAAPGHVFNLGH